MSANFVQLGSVADFINGAAFRPEDWNGSGPRIIRIQNLTDPSKPYNRTDRKVDDKLRVRPGELLVSWSATLGVFEWMGPDDGVLNQHIFRVVPHKNKVAKSYLRHALEGALIEMQRHLHGATMQHVNRGEFLATKLFLPALAEQRRIAEMLDRAVALRGKRRAALAYLDTLTESIFFGAESDKALSYFLKICANATSYGMYFELTPQKLINPVEVKVFSGEHCEELTVSSVERPGTFYFPPIAALITGGAHLMLALIQRCIEDRGGHYLFCDTDSMCIVASENGGWVPCPGERGPNGEYGIKALSWKEVDEIVQRFESLNPYDRKKVPGSILKIEDVNFHNDKRIELFAYAISAKRYVMYRYDKQGNIVIVDAKAHGLGYLYPPRESRQKDSEDDWIYEAWHGILESAGLATPRPIPDYHEIPAMMRIAATTPAVLGMLKGITRPNNFVFMPLPFPTYDRKGTKREANFNLTMPFSKRREEWASTKAIDTRTGKKYNIHPGVDRNGRKRRGEVWVKTYGNILGEYRAHPEAKFVDRDGNPCTDTTRGLLRPSHITAAAHRYIGKETSRHWEQGDDMDLVDFKCMEYRNGKVIANKETRERIAKFGVRKIERGTRIHHDTIILITKGKAVKPITLAKIVKFLDEQNPREKPFSTDTLNDLPDLEDTRERLDPKKQEKLISLYRRRIKRLEQLKEQKATK